MASNTGATANLACFGWLRNRDGLSEKSGYDVAAPYPTLARVKFGNGQVETARHAVDAPIVSAGQMEASTTSPVAQNTPALMSKGALEPRDGHLDFAQDMLHLRKIGAVANLRTNQAGHCVLDAPGFAREMPHGPSHEKVVCMTPPCAVNNIGQLAHPEAASTNPSEVKR